MYTLFITIHVTCVTVILLAVSHFFVFFFLILIGSQTYYHRIACVPYVLTAVGLYAFDHLVRVVRTRCTTGWLTAEHALNRGTTLVHVPSLRAGWRAGQHVRVRVVSGGWLTWLATWLLCRARPFTIGAGSNSAGLMLQIKALGSWSCNLLRVAGDPHNTLPARRPEQISTDVERVRGSAREVRVIIEGPYGNYYDRCYLFSGAADTVTLKAVQGTFFILLIREPSLSLVAVAFHMS